MGGDKKTSASSASPASAASDGSKAPPSPLALALRLLSYRDRPGKALSEKLAEKGIADKDIQDVLETLASEGLVDDERFARELVSSRIRNRNWGPRKIALDLVRKGVDRALADRVISGLDEAEVEGAALRAYEKWAHRRGHGPGEPLPREDFVKACRHLESRGFSTGLIMKVVRGSAADE